MQQLKSPQRSRGLAVAATPDRKPSRVDKLGVWLSKAITIERLWVGTTESKPYPARRRVEEALQIIKRHDALNYSRIIRHLDRIWVHLLPSAQAHYDRSLNACVLDERYVLKDTMTLEQLASTIVHEATHARLEGWGIQYLEGRRAQIEAICLRRELNFLTKTPNSKFLRDEIVRTLEWSAGDHEFYSDQSFQRRRQEGEVETLRYLNAPNWLMTWASWLIRRRRERASALPRSQS
ncbi:hypothetical protein [Bradyrhizobium sp. Ec3.3]|uniref:hypothetical protein n=1 Tax=Bradyrhizobium sp. Ec3.3 TaxID=189753 RepID=UPI0004892047|nr:hypothetical protein [Bradyrhizobium sp. Ec3.3]